MKHHFDVCCCPLVVIRTWQTDVCHFDRADALRLHALPWLKIKLAPHENDEPPSFPCYSGDGAIKISNGMRMKIEGGCHCGKISYEADINPEYVVICHCTDCQIISGAPYRASVPAKAESFRLRGQPKTYVKTARSGNKRALAFCADCGSGLYSTSLEDHPSLFNLRLGAVKQRAQLIPKSQGFCSSAMPWVMDIALIPQNPEQS